MSYWKRVFSVKSWLFRSRVGADRIGLMRLVLIFGIILMTKIVPPSQPCWFFWSRRKSRDSRVFVLVLLLIETEEPGWAIKEWEDDSDVEWHKHSGSSRLSRIGWPARLAAELRAMRLKSFLTRKRVRAFFLHLLYWVVGCYVWVWGCMLVLVDSAGLRQGGKGERE